MVTIAEPEFEVGALHHGHNVCLFYEHTEEELAAIVPFIRDALDKGDRCVYITDGIPLQSIIAALDAGGVSTAPAQESGKLVIMPKDDFYAGEEIEPATLANRVERLTNEALRAGFRGLRVVLEATWRRGPGIDRASLARWDETFNAVFSRAPLALICAYNRRILPPQVLQFGLRAHPMMAMGSCVHPNPYYEPSEMTLGQTTDAARVSWMLQQVERAHAVDRALRVHATEQAVVAELGQEGLAGSTVPLLIHHAVERVKATLEVDFCGVMELLPDRSGFVLLAGTGWSAETIGQIRAGLGNESLAGYALDTHSPVVVEDWGVERRITPPIPLIERGVTSSMGVIIEQHGTPFGVITAHTIRKRLFRSDDINFLRGIANVLAAAIDRARGEERMAKLLASEQEARSRAELAQQRRDAQYRVTAVLLGEPTLESAAPKILEVLCQGLHWHVGVLWMVDPDKGGLTCCAIWHDRTLALGPFVDLTRQTMPHLHEGWPGEVWAAGTPLWLPDIAKEEGSRREVAVEAGLHAALFFPILTGPNILGVGELICDQVKPADDEMLQSLVVLGYQLGEYIERKRNEETILRLSTPVLPIAKSLLLVPVIGALDMRRAAQLTDRLLAAIRTSRARAAVIDVTGAMLSDPQVVEALVRTVEASRLLGAAVLVTGVSSSLSRTLVEMRSDLRRLRTKADLQSGIEEALKSLSRVPVFQPLKAPEAGQKPKAA